MAAKQEWLVILPDYPGALEKRMAVRTEHLSNTKPDVKDGGIVFGGASLDAPQQDGKPLQINGSVMIFVAETKEKALERVYTDIYYKSDVWDKDKIQIMPFKSAIREQL